jgi:hypothetical protein
MWWLEICDEQSYFFGYQMYMVDNMVEKRKKPKLSSLQNKNVKRHWERSSDGQEQCRMECEVSRTQGSKCERKTIKKMKRRGNVIIRLNIAEFG